MMKCDFSRISPIILTLNHVIKYMDSTDLSSLTEQFLRSTAELDSIRGEKLSDVFPELNSLNAWRNPALDKSACDG